VLLLPHSIVGPFAGVLLDRWSRRQVLVFANLTRVVLAAAIAGLVAGDVTGPTFYITVLACLSVNRFLLAGLSAALPHTVPREDLVMANAVSPTCGTLSFLAGLGVGYSIRAALPGAADRNADAIVVGLAAVGYAAAAALALRMHRDLLGPDYDPARPAVRAAARHVLAGLVDGARHVYRRPAATAALAAIAVQRVGYAVTTIAAILLYRNYFNDPADVDAGLAGLGLGVASAGIGFALAAVITPLGVARVGKRRWIISVLLAAAVLQIVPTALYTQPAIVVAALLIGLSAQSLKISVDTVVQEEVDDAYRGRVFSFYDVLFNAAFVAAAALAALMLPPSGRSYLVLVMIAVLYALAAYGYAHATRRASADGRSSVVPGIACDA
jgi:MFS family permease